MPVYFDCPGLSHTTCCTHNATSPCTTITKTTKRNWRVEMVASHIKTIDVTPPFAELNIMFAIGHRHQIILNNVQICFNNNSRTTIQKTLDASPPRSVAPVLTKSSLLRFQDKHTYTRVLLFRHQGLSHPVVKSPFTELRGLAINHRLQIILNGHRAASFGCPGCDS